MHDAKNELTNISSRVKINTLITKENNLIRAKLNIFRFIRLVHMKRIYQPFFVQVFFILPSGIDTIKIQTVKRTAYITKRKGGGNMQQKNYYKEVYD